VIVVIRELAVNAKLHLADDGRNDGAELDVRELLADAAMATRTERLVRRLGALRNRTKPEIDLLAALVRVLRRGLLRDALRVAPARGLPVVRGAPDCRVHLRDERGGEDIVALGDDVSLVLARVGERAGDGHVVHDLAHDGVDRWVHAEGLTDDGVEDGQGADVVEGHGAPGAVRRAEVLGLFLVESIAEIQVRMLSVPICE
jgi:hypothetical protein